MNKTNKKNDFLIKQSNILNRNKISYFSANIELIYDEKEKKYKKIPKNIISFKNKKIETIFDKNKNALIIPLGEVYNLIGVDVDNKNKTIEFFEKLVKDNNYDLKNTFSVKTLNNGFHYYFSLSNSQKNILKKFQASTALCFSTKKKPRNIDIKYNNQIFFGPAYLIYNNKVLGYKINNKSKPDKLPEFLFMEIVRTMNKNNKIIVKPNVNKKDKIILSEKEEEIIDVQCDFTKKEIKKIVFGLNKETRNEYANWLNLGIVLYNINKDFLSIWRKFSKQSDKYRKGECENKWDKFEKRKKEVKPITSLLKWLRNDNKEIYNKIIMQKNIMKIIEKQKKELPKNKLESNKIVSNDLMHSVFFKDKFCPISNCEHAKSSLYAEFYPNGLLMFKCRDCGCAGKLYPSKKLIKIPQQDLKLLFNIETLNIIQNQNNYYGNNDDIYIDDNIKIFENENTNTLLLNSLNGGTAYSIGKLIYALNKNKFNCTLNKEWYLFDGNIWKLNNGLFIREFISNELPIYYRKIIDFFINRKKNNINDNVHEINLKIKKINEIIKSLESTNFKNNVLTESCDIFYIKNQKFEENLDINPYLIGFNNGIYDLKNFKFRTGEANDYISLSVGYDYTNKKSKEYNNVIKFFEDIQPEKEERDYLLTFIASILENTNAEEIWHIFNGIKRNGKSKLSELLAITFGDYYGQIQSNLLTKERPSQGTPQPELINLRKKRIVIASEVENNQKLNTGFIKSVTGKDKFTGRMLYSNTEITYRFCFKLILLCNDKPNIDKPDDMAFWDRCRCVDFPTTFCDNPKNKNEKKADRHIDEKIKLWKNDFMILLLDYYKNYKKNGLIATNKVLQYTKKYKNDNDYYSSFVDEFIEKNEKGKVKWIDLKNTFIDWYKLNYDTNIPNIKNIKIYFEDKFFKEKNKNIRIDNSISKGWSGYILKEYI